MQGRLGACYERSRRLCMRLFEKPLFRDSDYLDTYNRLETFLRPQQLAAFAAVYAWRDRAARVADDAPHRIMPNATMLYAAQSMPVTAAQVSRLVLRRLHVAQAAASEVCARRGAC